MRKAVVLLVYLLLLALVLGLFDLLDAGSGESLAALEGERPGGVFVLPVPSGNRRILVTASGYDPYEASMKIDPAAAKATLEVRLGSR